METIAYNLKHIPDESLRDPVYGPLPKIRRFEKEQNGPFRDSVRDSAYDVVYIGEGVRSEFIESIHL